MEILLAILVAIAVLIFGALISLGNERQKRSIDDLREQMVSWAIQDLEMKQVKLAQDIRVDALAWFNRLAAKTFGKDLGLQVIESFDNPHALVFATLEGSQIIFSPLSPQEIERMKRDRRKGLSRYDGNHPLLSLPAKSTTYEFSILNGGYMFNVELALAWKEFSEYQNEKMNRLWLYA